MNKHWSELRNNETTNQDRVDDRYSGGDRGDRYDKVGNREGREDIDDRDKKRESQHSSKMMKRSVLFPLPHTMNNETVAGPVQSPALGWSIESLGERMVDDGERGRKDTMITHSVYNTAHSVNNIILNTRQ